MLQGHFIVGSIQFAYHSLILSPIRNWHTLYITTATTTDWRPFVRDYPGEPVPEETLTHPPSWSSFNLYQLLPPTWSIASSLFNSRAWQSFCTTSLHVLFGLPLGLEPSTSYSIRFFTQSVSSFRNTKKTVCFHHSNTVSSNTVHCPYWP